MLKRIILSIRCQNFNSISPIGQKFDVFAKMAFKSTALWPLKVMDQFFDPLLVLLQVLYFSFEQSGQVSEISHISQINSSHNRLAVLCMVLLRWFKVLLGACSEGYHRTYIFGFF